MAGDWILLISAVWFVHYSTSARVYQVLTVVLPGDNRLFFKVTVSHEYEQYFKGYGFKLQAQY